MDGERKVSEYTTWAKACGAPMRHERMAGTSDNFG
jgi:hypothetical protein